MKATFQLPDELYRAVKVETAREGRTLREVTIGLFEAWLSERQPPQAASPSVDWLDYKPPLAHLVPSDLKNHSMEKIRESVVQSWNEKN